MGLFSLFQRRPTPRPTLPDLASSAFKADPFPYYARLREQSPVLRIVLPTREPAYLVTRYDDVAAVLRDERFAKDTNNAMTPAQTAEQPWFRNAFKALKRNMLDLDPPDHTRLRALVQKAFTPKLVEQMRPQIERITGELLDVAARRGVFDLIHDFALPLPTRIIAEMLGVPAKDWARFHRWTKSVIAAAASRWGMVLAIPNVMAFLRYIRRFIRQRRASPQGDLVSDLIRAEEAGDTMSEDELLAMVFLLLVAGHETTVNLVGNGTLALLQHRDQLELLRGDPTLIKPAVEELLRFTSPVETATERYTRCEVALGGVTIPQGEMVIAALASANRDERQFAQPDVLNLTRDPNRHLSFGVGIHFCLGASLARLEAQIAVNTLLARAPNLQLAVPEGKLRWRRGLILRGLESLPVSNAR
jgi:cytochrome P450 PksS